MTATGQCVGITDSTAQALAAARWRRQVFPGSHDPKHLDPEALTRVAPTVLFSFGSIEDALHLACEASRITCQAPGALDACRLFAASLHAALAGEPKEHILDPPFELQDTTGVRAQGGGDQAQGQHQAAAGRPDKHRDAGRSALGVRDNLHLSRRGAPRRQPRRAAADAVTAAYGQLAGRRITEPHAIPDVWRSALVQPGLDRGLRRCASCAFPASRRARGSGKLRPNPEELFPLRGLLRCRSPEPQRALRRGGAVRRRHGCGCPMKSC